MRKTFFLLLIFSTSFSNISKACGNEYGYTLDGERIYTRYFYLTPRMLAFNIEAINERVQDLSKTLEGDSENFKTWSDLAINLLKLGDVDSAYSILQPLQIEHPKEYTITANLGTCYELMGELDSALKYISKGYELNKNSHFKSEWVHVKILEAKIKRISNSRWIIDNPILSQDDLKSRIGNAGHKNSVRIINNQLMYQLRTRAPFTPAPNEVMTNLLLSLAEFNKTEGTYENALLAYVYAMKFENNGYRRNKISQKIKKLNTERDEVGISNLSDQFIRIMKLAELEPSLLLLGLDDFAIEMDSVKQSRDLKIDSLVSASEARALENKKLKEELETTGEKFERLQETLFLFMFGCAVLLIVIVILVVKKKKNTSKK